MGNKVISSIVGVEGEEKEEAGRKVTSSDYNHLAHIVMLLTRSD